MRGRIVGRAQVTRLYANFKGTLLFNPDIHKRRNNYDAPSKNFPIDQNPVRSLREFMKHPG